MAIINLMSLTSSLNLASTTPLQKQQLRKMKTILQMLMDNPDSSEFRSPVQWEQLGLNDYPLIIKQPMDLGTISSKLQGEKYRWVEEMLDDIQLIWDNCKTYNHSGSWIYLLADKMDKFFKKLIKNYFNSVAFATPAQNKPAEKERQRDREKQRERQRQRERERERERERQRQREAQRQKQKQSAPLPQTRTSRAASRKIDRSRAIDWDSEQQRDKYQDRLRLSDQLKRLNAQNLGRVVEVLLQDCPAACQYLEETRCQIFLDKVQPWICEEIKEYFEIYLQIGSRITGNSIESLQACQKR